MQGPPQQLSAACRMQGIPQVRGGDAVPTTAELVGMQGLHSSRGGNAWRTTAVLGKSRAHTAVVGGMQDAKHATAAAEMYRAHNCSRPVGPVRGGK